MNDLINKWKDEKYDRGSRVGCYNKLSKQLLKAQRLHSALEART